MALRKLLFLDIDGVIWTVAGDLLAQKNKIPHEDHRELDPTRVVLLERLLEKHPDVDVVVSSTWRLGRTVEQLAVILGPVIGPRIVGKTKSLRTKEKWSIQRGYEITDFLKSYPPIADYIVLDDDADMITVASHWFKTNTYDGMSFKDYILLDKYLKLKPNSLPALKIRLTNFIRWSSIIIKYYLYRKHLQTITWRLKRWLK